MTAIPARKHFSLSYEHHTLKQRELEESLDRAIYSAGCQHLGDVYERFCEIDLSHSYWHDLGALLWLVALLHKLKRQGNEILLAFPERNTITGKKLWDFLLRWKFFDTLAVCVDDPVNLLRPEQVPYTLLESSYTSAHTINERGEKILFHSTRLLEMTTLTPDIRPISGDAYAVDGLLGKYQDKVLVAALSDLCGWDLALTKRFVQDVIAEGVCNAFGHGKASFASVVMRADKKYLAVAIADNGLGIPRVLREAFEAAGRASELATFTDVDLIKYFTEPELILLDSKVIELAVQKGVTSSRAREGLGLYYMKSLILSNGGELRIRSGRALVDFKQGNTVPTDRLIESPGTVFRIMTPLRR